MTRLLLFFLLLGTSLAGQTIFDNVETVYPHPVANAVTKMRYYDVWFLGLGTKGAMISSQDGITWSRHNTGIRKVNTGQINFSDVAYGNGLFVIITDGQGDLLVSPDLEDWTITRPPELSDNFSSVYFHDGLFYFGGEGVIATSADGVNFTTIETPGFDRIRSMIYADEQFVAVGDNALIMTSADGATWTVIDHGFELKSNQRRFNFILHANGRFVVTALDGSIATSTGGVTWTSIIFEEDNSDFYSVGADDTHFYFPGTQGRLWKTPDLVSWEQIASGHNSILYGIVTGGGQTVLTGTGGFIATSDDFETWTDRRIGWGSVFTKCAYAFGNFYLLNQLNGILKSSDGETWTESFVPSEVVVWTNMTFGDGKLVALNRDAGLAFTEDGTNWTEVDYDLATPGNDYAANLNFYNGLWYITGAPGIFYSSPDLENWTDISLDPADDYRDLAYNGETFVLVGFNGNLFSSTDGVEWIDRNEGGNENFTGVSYDNGLFLLGAAGAEARLYVSTDGIEWTPRTGNSVPNSTSDIYFIEHQFFTGNTQGKLVLSPDTEYWREGFLDIDLVPLCFCVGDGKVVIGGGSPGLVMSGDLPPEYNLTVSSNGNGSVDVYPVLDTYPRGISVRLDPFPDLDYGFDGWSGDSGSNQDPYYFTLWDGDRSVFANFVITATGYRLWLFDHFSDEERADDAISGYAVDTDKDGRINLLEYVGNTNPMVKDPQPFCEYDLIEEAGESYLLISYTAESQLDELETYVEFSEDMETWSSNEDGGDTYTELYDTLVNEDGSETLFHKLLKPLSEGERKFLRVRFIED